VFQEEFSLNLNKCYIVRYAKRPVTIPSTYHINNRGVAGYRGGADKMAWEATLRAAALGLGGLLLVRRKASKQ